MSDNSIGVLLTSHKRPHTLRPQLAAIDAQTIKPADIVIFHDNGGVQPDLEAMRGRKVIASNWNMGVWPRFAAALYLLPYDFICIFDDDTIPGNAWLEHCLSSYKTNRALYGACGVIFRKGRRDQREYVSGLTGHCGSKEVDIIGHSWFVSRSILQHSLALPSCVEIGTAGEDYHVSWAAQDLGMPCVVPASWIDDIKGSLRVELGTDDVALYRQPGEEEKKARAHQFYLDRGWKPLALRKQHAHT